MDKLGLTDKSQYRVPLGNGTTKVTLFKNYLKHKFNNPDLWWIEDEPLKIYPECKLNYKKR